MTDIMLTCQRCTLLTFLIFLNNDTITIGTNPIGKHATLTFTINALNGKQITFCNSLNMLLLVAGLIVEADPSIRHLKENHKKLLKKQSIMNSVKLISGEVH